MRSISVKYSVSLLCLSCIGFGTAVAGPMFAPPWFAPPAVAQASQPNAATSAPNQKEPADALSRVQDLLKADKATDAVEAASKALQAEPSAAGKVALLGWRAKGYIDLTEDAKALADLTQALNLDSRSSLIYNFRGLYFLMQGDFQSAIKDLDRDRV